MENELEGKISTTIHSLCSIFMCECVKCIALIALTSFKQTAVAWTHVRKSNVIHPQGTV